MPPMQDLLSDYLPIVIFMAIAAGLAVALMASAFIIAVRNPDPEKLSAYECGFNPFDDARMKFDVRFYLVSLLFIIFDLEVAFLFPWAIAFDEIGAFGFWAMMIFLAVLTVGFAYERRHRRAGRDELRRLLRRACRQRLPAHDRRRPHQLVAHRLAHVDDVRACLLRDRDDASLHAALRSRALRLRAPRQSATIRRDDRGRHAVQQDGAGTAQGLRPNARAAICHLYGVL